MDTHEVLGTVSDRLVRGMMFHSDHADMMRMVGMPGFAKLHEQGFHDDSHAYRNVRSKCIKHVGMLTTHGSQRSQGDLDGLDGRHRDALGPSERQRWVKSAFDSWVDWETGTVKCYASAVSELEGHESLRRLVRRLQRDTEEELSRAKEIKYELEACGYDMGHMLDMQHGGDHAEAD